MKRIFGTKIVLFLILVIFQCAFLTVNDIAHLHRNFTICYSVNKWRYYTLEVDSYHFQNNTLKFMVDGETHRINGVEIYSIKSEG